MIESATSTISASMVDCQTFWNGAYEKFPGHAVRRPSLAFIPHLSIAVLGFVLRPLPAVIARIMRNTLHKSQGRLLVHLFLPLINKTPSKVNVNEKVSGKGTVFKS